MSNIPPEHKRLRNTLACSTGASLPISSAVVICPGIPDGTLKTSSQMHCFWCNIFLEIPPCNTPVRAGCVCCSMPAPAVCAVTRQEDLAALCSSSAVASRLRSSLQESRPRASCKCTSSHPGTGPAAPCACDGLASDIRRETPPPRRG